MTVLFNQPERVRMRRSTMIVLALVSMLSISQPALAVYQAGKHITGSITIEQAEDIIRSVLDDPDAAKFGDAFVVTNHLGQAVCGTLRAKNGYGAYRLATFVVRADKFHSVDSTYDAASLTWLIGYCRPEESFKKCPPLMEYPEDKVYPKEGCDLPE